MQLPALYPSQCRKTVSREKSIKKTLKSKSQNQKTQEDFLFTEEKETNLQVLQKLFLQFLSHTKKFSPHTIRAYKKDLESLLKENNSAKLLNKSSHKGNSSQKDFNQNNSLKAHSYKQKAQEAGFDKSNSNQDILAQQSSSNQENSNQDTLAHPPLRTIIQDQKKLEQEIKFLIQKNITKNSKWKNATRSRKLASARTFIKWLTKEKYLKEDFRHLFKSPKPEQQIPFFLSVDEVLVIIELFKKKKLVSPEDKTLFFLIYGGGLRVSEACQLKNKNIDWHHKTIKIKGKGGKYRFIFLPEYAFSSLSAIRNNHEYFFGHKALSERKAYDKIKRIGKLAGFSKTLHPHALRHSFATHMLRGGSEIRVLQELLGHKTLTATQKYTHLDLAYLDKTLENFHPLNKDLKLLKK